MANNQVLNLEKEARILLIETQASVEGSLFQKLSEQNIEPLLVVNQIESLVELIATLEPAILFFSVDTVDDKLVQCLSEVNDNSPLPTAVFAHHHCSELLQSLVSSGVNSYIVDDIASERIPVIINLVETRFSQEQKFRCELAQTRAKLSERKVIEKAKGLIMAQKKISEEQAYAQLRKSAMNQCRPMVDLAKSVISVFEQH